MGFFFVFECHLMLLLYYKLNLSQIKFNVYEKKLFCFNFSNCVKLKLKKWLKFQFQIYNWNCHLLLSFSTCREMTKYIFLHWKYIFTITFIINIWVFLHIFEKVHFFWSNLISNWKQLIPNNVTYYLFKIFRRPIYQFVDSL